LLLTRKGFNNMNKIEEIYNAVFGLAVSARTTISWYNDFFTMIHLNIHNEHSFFRDNKDEKLRSYKPDEQRRALARVGRSLIEKDDYMLRHGFNKIYLCKDPKYHAAPFGRGNYLLFATSEDFDLDEFTSKRGDNLEYFVEITISEVVNMTHPRCLDTSSNESFPSLSASQRAPQRASQRASLPAPMPVTNHWDRTLETSRDEVLSPVTGTDETTIRTSDSNMSLIASGFNELNERHIDPKDIAKALLGLNMENPNHLWTNLSNALQFLVTNQGLFQCNPLDQELTETKSIESMPQEEM
jgi:hypothetical protein